MMWKRKGNLQRGPVGSDVRVTLLLKAMRAFKEAEKEPAQHSATPREHDLIAEYAEPVVVPTPLCGREG